MQKDASKICKRLSPARFNHYVMGLRDSLIPHTFEELSYWASYDEQILGIVGRDRIDNDYSWIVLARDLNGRFRCINLDINYLSKRRAEDALLEKIKYVINSGKVDTYGHQGDEDNTPINLLKLPTDFDPKTLHPYFRVVLENPRFEPARAILKEIGPWLAPTDPHLVKEFQKKGFDQRLWEIYLWATFREFNFDLELLESPDFLCTAPGIDFCIESTTVGPSEKGVLAKYPDTSTDEGKKMFANEYMPMKFASALTSKLNKTDGQGRHYWNLEKSKDKPFVIAIADFHKPNEQNEIGTMTHTENALWQYLYGHRIYRDMENGQPIIKEEDVKIHRYENKEIPSGFFNLPEAENVSAVLFSNAGTISKFNRMGVLAGLGNDNYRYLRAGFRHDPDPNATIGQWFEEEILAEGYEEYWSDEIQILHNPNATNRLPFDWFPGVIHHFCENGSFYVYGPEGTILSSFTIILPKNT